MSEGNAADRFEEPLRIGSPAGLRDNMRNGLPMVELPDDNRTGGDFAEELGRHLASVDIYRRGKILMVLKPKRDGLEPVGDHEFRTLLERYVCVYQARVPKKAGEEILRIRKTIGIDLARMTMSSPQMLDSIREVEHVHDVPQPAMRPDGSLYILKPGYDAMSKTLTLNECDYAN